MSKLTYVLPLALLISGAAHAVSDNPWYAGARIGGTHYNNFEGIIKGADDQLDKDDFGGGVFVGYNFVPWFALEGGYTHLGKLKSKVDGGGSFETQGIDLVGKFTWQAMDSFDLFAKAGGYGYKVKAGNEKENGFAPTAGVGAEYFFTDNLSTRLEYQYYFNLGDKDKTGRIDAQFYGISLVYGWGAPAPVAVVEPEPVLAEPVVVEPVVVQVEPLTQLLPFAFDSNALSQADIDRLQPIAQRLVDYPETELFVIGHTDSRGADAYNQKLSEQRADVVAGYLASHFNIDANRIKTEGRGETQPIATNDNEEGRAQNRRVEVYTPGFEVQQ
ncbi:OmpA family protein [Photobacterium swingsii]|uniref:OmpA family protein n=1 Tax=Photobacterium swingsii TaxID=680026 RepID=UPI003D0BCB27